MRWAMLTLSLAGCATISAAGDLPSRRAVSEAIAGWSNCEPDETTPCPPPPRRVELTALRCIPAGEPEQPARVLCRFSGARIMGVRRLRFSGECAYLVRSGQSRWHIRNFPDADVCAF